MCILGKDPRKERANQDPLVAVAAVVVVVAAESMLETWKNLLERVRKFYYPLTSVGDVEMEDTRKGQPCKAVEAVCRNCGTKGHYEKMCMKKSTHLVNVPGTSTNSEPDYFNEHRDPVYAHTHMVHVKETNRNKHLIQFPIGTDFKKVRNSQDCSTVLLKTDTGADVNLMNSTTFDRIIGNGSILQPSTLRMEAYGNSAVEVLGKFHAFLRWKGRVSGNYSLLLQPMNHLIYYPAMVATP